MKRTLAVLTGAMALVVTACGGGGDPLAGSSGGSAAQQPPAPAQTIRVGSANFTENRVLAEIYAQALEAHGVTVERQFGIGSREIYFPALKDGSIDLIPEYSGNLLQEINPQTTATAADAVYAEIGQHLPDNLTVLDQSAAENKDAVVVTPETAQKYNAKSIADLAPHCADLTFGGPPEFSERPYGLPGLEKLYNCKFGQFRSLDAGGPITISALGDGSIQAADLFTTDPTIEDKGWVVLDDPQNNFAAQRVLPLVNKQKATDGVRQTLNAISAALTTEDLVEMNRKLNDAANNSVESVAKEWLTSKNLL